MKEEIIKHLRREREFIEVDLNNWNNPEFYTIPMPESVQKRKREEMDKLESFIEYLKKVTSE